MDMMTIMAITITWVVAAVVWTNDYYSYSHTVRDGAAPGSGMLSDLENIRTTTMWILPLQILGLATFLVGFGFAFANILRNVRLRGDTMAAALPALKERKTSG